MSHPCLSCGACCAYFRIAFHWSETDPFLGGTVPAELTEKLDPHRVVMRGTQSKTPRCVALVGTIGVAAHCGIHPIKPSVCREVEPSWEFGRHSPQCDKGRIAHGLAPLTPDQQHEMAQRLGAKDIVFSGAGHSPAVELPDAVAEALLDFFRTVES